MAAHDARDSDPSSTRDGGDSAVPRSLSASRLALPSMSPSIAPPTARRASSGRVAAAWRRSAWLSDAISGGTHSGRLRTVSNDSDEGGPIVPVDERRPLASRRSSMYSSYATFARSPRGYETDAMMAAPGASGVRSWYADYSSIDWLHDTVKEHARQRSLRSIKGIRGVVAQAWDRLQGWLLVIATGVLTACVALVITRSEILLFESKLGYCTTGIFTARRWCCPAEAETAAPSSMLSTWRATEVAECAHWRTWSEALAGSPLDRFSLDFVAYIVIAVGFGTLASVLTVYLTSSDLVYSSKDAVDPFGLGQEELKTDEVMQEKPMTAPRKTLFYAAGSGISEVKVILSGFTVRGFLGGTTLFVKSVGLTLSVASGLSLGKEGPFVHIASAIANILTRFSPQFDLNEGRRREILSAACAAGVAVSFGAPLGGVLFSLEEASYFFPAKTMLRSFVCALTAFLSLKAFNPFKSGKVVLFETSFDKDTAFLELIGFAILGVVGGLYGALFCKANVWWTANVRRGTRLGQHPILEVMLVTLLTSLFAFVNPFTRLGGTEFVAELFSECRPLEVGGELCVREPSAVGRLVKQLAVATLIKVGLTVITFGLRLPAGVFIPSLAVGAAIGRIFALGIEYLYTFAPTASVFASCDASAEFGQRCVLPGVWAMVGAASTLAGVTRTTISLVVIMSELTSSLNYVAPVMVGVIVAKACGDVLDHRSIYDLVLAAQELPYLDGKVDPIFDHAQTLSDVLDAHAPVIDLSEENTIATLRDQLRRLDDAGGGFPIVSRDHSDDGGPRVQGHIASRELAIGLASVTHLPDDTPCSFTVDGSSLEDSVATTPETCSFGHLTDHAPIALHIRSPLEVIQELFVKLGVRFVLVHDERGHYRGVITKSAWIHFVEELGH